MDYYTAKVSFKRTDSGYLVEAFMPDGDNLRDHYTIGTATLTEDIEKMTADLKPRLEEKLEEIETKRDAS